MEWTYHDFDKANHPPVVLTDGEEFMTVRAGETLKINASRSSDPDGNSLIFDWQIYYEAGTTFLEAGLSGDDTSEVSFLAPRVSKPEKYHLILSVTDSGEPALTRYKRVIIEVNP